jgi:integrase
MAARRQVSELRRKDILAARNAMADHPGAANNWLKTVRVLLDFAVDMEYISHNVAREHIEKLRPAAAGGWRSWHEHEITAYLDHWPLGTLQHRVVTLALYTGAARIDLVGLGWPNVSNGRIRYQRQKTIRHEEPVTIDLPIAPPLAEMLATIPRTQLTFLETKEGKPRNERGLTFMFSGWVAKAGLGAPDANGRHLSLHGLRKAVGRRLAEAGCSPHMIMSVLGHRDIKSSAPYTKDYDRARSADQASEMLGEIWAAEQKVTKLRRTTE